MGMIDTLFAETLAATAFDLDLFPSTESITYIPVNGSPKTITAIVAREGARPSFRGAGKAQGDAVEIWIQVSDVASIDSTADRITMRLRQDKQPQSCRITQVHGDSDSATWHLTLAG